MTKLKTFALSAAAAGALGASLAANAAFIDIPEDPVEAGFYITTGLTVGTFCSGATPATYRTPRYSFQCFKTGMSLDPAAAHMANTTLPSTMPIQLQQFTLNGIVTGVVNFTASSSAAETGSLSYFISVNPDIPAAIRLDLVTLSQETLASGDAANTGSRKQITGQTVPGIIDPATFTADLVALGQGGTAQATCGVCRVFAVTDTYDNRVNDLGAAGRIQSVSNAYDTLEQPEVPVPAPLALMAIGLIGIGAARRHRKA